MCGHFLGILKQINRNGKGLKAVDPASDPEATVPGCGGPLARWPKAEVAWPARAGRRGAPPCRGHLMRGRDGGAADVCSPVAPVRHGRRHEHHGGEAHPPGNRGVVGLTNGVNRL
jgi:hypothetical protein